MTVALAQRVLASHEGPRPLRLHIIRSDELVRLACSSHLLLGLCFYWKVDVAFARLFLLECIYNQDSGLRFASVSTSHRRMVRVYRVALRLFSVGKKWSESGCWRMSLVGRGVWRACRHETPVVKQRRVPDSADAGGELVGSDVVFRARPAAGYGHVSRIASLTRIRAGAVGLWWWHQLQHGAIASGQHMHVAATAGAHTTPALDATAHAAYNAQVGKRIHIIRSDEFLINIKLKEWNLEI